MSRSFSSTVSHVVVWPPLSFFTFLLASCSASFAGASSGSLHRVWSTVSPSLYQSRTYASLRPLTDTARVIQWTIPIRGLYLMHFTPFSLKFVKIRYFCIYSNQFHFLNGPNRSIISKDIATTERESCRQNQNKPL